MAASDPEKEIEPKEGLFQAAYKNSTLQLEEAIKDLNNLQAEIASYMQAEEWKEKKEFRLIQWKTPEASEVEDGRKTIFDKNCQVPAVSTSLESSVCAIQSLLGDTGEKCNKIIENNRDTANRLDGELEKCQEEMENLKKELAYATRCVNDLEVNMMINGSATESDNEAQAAECELEVTVCRLREENGRLHLHVKALQHELILLKSRPLFQPIGNENCGFGSLKGISEEEEIEEDENCNRKMDDNFTSRDHP